MLLKYKFYDTNIYGNCNEEYDICGDEYKIFLNTCFKYSKYFSMTVKTSPCQPYDTKQLEEFEEYRILPDEDFFESTGVYSSPYFEIRYYELCPKLFTLITKVTDSLFKWIDGKGYSNPEDPIFFREDGSVFFRSVIHEGYCELCVREGEDVLGVVDDNRWFLSKSLINGFALSCDNGHRLICKDWFYTYPNQTSVSSYVTEYCFNNRYIGAKRVPFTSETSIRELLEKAEKVDYYVIDTVKNNYNGKLYGPYSKEKYEAQLTVLEVDSMGEWINTLLRPDGLSDSYEQF